MPRSDRFDHFTVPASDADRDLARRDKQEVAGQSAASHGETDILYGKRFAQTEAILRARAEERSAAEAEQHAAPEAPDMHLGSTEKQVIPSSGPPSSGAVGSEAGMPRMQRATQRDETPPLGSMPAEELPPAAEQVLAEPPGELIGAFRDQVGRSVRGVGEAARQLRAAGRELAGLAVEALRVAIRVGRSWLVHSPRRGRRV